jgi:hypothetical protein
VSGHPRTEPGEEPPSQQLFDLYRLAVEMADRISARRGAGNAFFLTLQTALAGFAGIIRPTSAVDGGLVQVDVFGIVIVSVVGLILSATWWLLLRSFRDLNAAKFKVILAIEAGFVAQPFGDEWQFLKQDLLKKRMPARYAELNVVERVVPIVFALVYVAIGTRAIVS